MAKKTININEIKTADYYITKARGLVGFGDYFNAIKYLRIALAYERDNYVALQMIGQLFAELGYVQEARSHFFLALNSAKDMQDKATTYLGLATMCAEEGDTENAFLYAAHAIYECKNDEDERELVKILLSDVLGVPAWELTEEYIARRNLLKLAGGYYYPRFQDNLAVDDLLEERDELPYDEELKKKSLEAYNNGDRKLAVKLMKRRLDIFDGDSMHFLFLYEYLQPKPKKRKPLTSLGEFDLPELQVAHYFEVLFELLSKDDYEFTRLFTSNGVVKLIVRWVLEVGITEIVADLAERIINYPHRDFEHALRHHLVFLHFGSEYVTWRLLECFFQLDIDEAVPYTVGNALHIVRATVPDEITGSTLLVHAYWSYAAAAAVIMPDDQIKTQAFGRLLLVKAKEAGENNFKSKNALVAVMLDEMCEKFNIVAREIDYISALKVSKATIKKYKRLLEL
jgi:tetratricopeptide (TPR) repeat protein